jgi:hypothetical protein
MADEIEVTETDETADTTEPEVGDEQEAETFSREYVQKLRDENAKQRNRAQRADEMAQRLHTELVAKTGRLADPADLPFDDEHLSDPEKLTAAIDALTEAKPHLKSRKPVGDIAQGNRGGAAESFDLMTHLKSLV